VNRLSAQVVLRKSVYWTRTVVHHDPAHIVTNRSQGAGFPRYFLACGQSVTGGRTSTYTGVCRQDAHVCVGCVKAVTS
jgi:hypothetical protein